MPRKNYEIGQDPVNGAFDVIDVVVRALVTTLSKKEVYTWLWKASQNEDAVARGEQP
jgi:hypothetical protein